MKRIVKGDLVDYVADAASLSKKAAGSIIDALLQNIADEVACGNEVAIKGFGTFEPRHRAERMGRNPATGAPIVIAASTTMGFRAAKAAKVAS